MNFLKQILKQNAMKKVFTLMIAAAIVFAGCSRDDDDVDNDNDNKTPPHAASTQTWTFGEQTWSDLIQMPDCNKADFDGGTPDESKPDGRSYTYKGKTYYYYSWPYVDANKATMCPSPWRVPTEQDLETFSNNVSAAMVINAWELSGYAMGSSMYSVGMNSNFWSSTETDNSTAVYQSFGRGSRPTDYDNKHLGFHVRCVK
jgi:hypothetical protein